ncbi:hypothetical protein [Variovorax soli]|uniref:Uncharacterized protein n=1 Tax=Variovorax soli TaxID=376815 RepID=A0ABU1NHT0_9BURK|nr:hypothetical protein [Variovorax soli]MDR6537581.1 hypothetical protein [Variovorax soli]
MKYSWLLVLMLFAFSADGAQRDWGNRVYSNVRLHEMEGDLTGWRIQIIQSEKEDYALIQAFEGVPSSPCLVRIEWQGNKFRSSPPQTCDFQSEIRGKIEKNRLIIEFPAGVQGAPNQKKAVLPLIR